MIQRKKNRLASGNYRVQVLDYVDDDGKRHYQSFTAETKAEAQAKANEWKYNRKLLKERKTVGQAVTEYISLKENVLSPSTIRGYRSIEKLLNARQISHIAIRDLKSADLQKLISELAIEHTAKYVKNYYGLIISAIRLHSPDFMPHVKLPAEKHGECYTPSKDDIQILLNHCKSTEAKLGILFGAVGFMRRGEACAVTFDDIMPDTCEIRITKTIVYDQDNLFQVKEPKTYSSYRTVVMPPYVFDMIKSLGRNKGTILNMNPNQLYRQFAYALEKSGLPHFRYHDLRHHAASYAHSIGINDRYTERMGGWKPNSSVLKRVYENVIDIEMVKAQRKFLKQQDYII